MAFQTRQRQAVASLYDMYSLLFSCDYTEVLSRAMCSASMLSSGDEPVSLIQTKLDSSVHLGHHVS